MQAFHPAKPLDPFPALRSADIARIEQFFSSAWGAHRFSVRGDRPHLQVHANYWRSQAVELIFCSHGARVEVEFPGTRFFRQHFAIRGAGEIRSAGAPVRAFSRQSYSVVQPDASVRIGSGPDLDMVVLRIDGDFLRRKHAALAGASRPLLFDTEAHAGGPVMDRLRRLLTFFITELERGDLTPLELVELEQSVAVTFLQANPPGRVTDRCPAPGAQQLKAVEDYIEAHWFEPLSVEALCQVSTMSARSIFHHFQRARGKSPMAFVKEVRLRHARRMLGDPEGRSVTEIAFACGFGNLGHFARDYRLYWGERPSETLQRGRKRV